MKLTAIFAFAFCAITQCAFVDNLKKCPLSDEDCIKKLFKEVITIASDSGFPEYDIQRIDPLSLQNIPLVMPGILNINFIEGTIEGMKSSSFDTIHVNMDTKQVEGVLAIPSITAKGKYILHSGQFMKNVLGNDISGEGNGQVDLEKVKINILFAFTLEKDGDNIYIKQKRDESKVTFAVLGNTKFQADNIRLGDEDVTKTVMEFMNNNAKTCIDAFANFFNKVGVNLVYEVLQKFFDKVPANSIFIDIE